MKVIGLIGNPNCGKSTIFNALTGARQVVGNWPGVTVDTQSGETSISNETVKVVDLPGIYSLTATSEDERASLKYVLSKDASLYVNVLDATALERNLYLTLLLCELKVPMVIVVTMMDIARHRNLEIDLDHLSAHLGVPVIGINANSKVDIYKLKEMLGKALVNDASLIPSVQLDYGNELEQEIDILASCTIKTAQGLNVSPRWVAIKALEGDPFIRERLVAYHDMANEVVDGAIDRITKVLADPPDVELAEARYGVIAGLVHDVVRTTRIKILVSELIDRFVLNRFLGFPLFLAVMMGVFALVSFAGGTPTEFFNELGEAVFQHIPSILTLSIFGELSYVPEIVYGIGGAFTVLFSFVPVIFCVFFALSILEDSGYMARAAFLADRLMRWMGLPGKSFVPMLVGFGCSVPAILATRSLESKRDRLLTIFMIPFMSCGAKLPVYAAFAVAFSPTSPWKMIAALYFTGVVLGVLSGLALKRTLFRGIPTHFIMELPPYHLPRLKHILYHTWERLWGFLWRAGKFIVPMMLVLGLLNTPFKHSNTTLLSSVGRTLTPIFRSIGIEKDNWPASVAIFTGLFAKESVIGTMNGLYEQEASREKRVDELNAWQQLRQHFPKGFHQAFSFLLFVLLYVPCVGALAVVFKEIGKLYGVIFAGYLTVFGWSVATIYHAMAVSGSLIWLAVGSGVLVLMFAGFWVFGKHHRVDMI